jgi:hypothetical protein
MGGGKTVVHMGSEGGGVFLGVPGYRADGNRLR